MTTPTTTPSDDHLLSLKTEDFSTGFTCTTVEAPQAQGIYLNRFDRDGHHFTTVGLHKVTDFKVDYDDGLYGPTITMNVGGEKVTIHIFLAKPEA